MKINVMRSSDRQPACESGWTLFIAFFTLLDGVHSIIFCIILLLNIPCPPEYVFCVGAKVPSALLAVDTRRPIIVRNCAMRSACFFSTFVLSSLPTSSLILAWFCMVWTTAKHFYALTPDCSTQGMSPCFDS